MKSTTPRYRSTETSISGKNGKKIESYPVMEQTFLGCRFAINCCFQEMIQFILATQTSFIQYEQDLQRPFVAYQGRI